MGLTVSTSNVINKVTQKQIQKGGSVNCSNQIGDVNVDVSGGRQCTINIDQECTVSNEQLFNGIHNELTDAVNKNTATKELFGIGIVGATSTTKSIMNQIQDQQCGNASVSNIIGNAKFNFDNVGVCNLNLKQLGNSKQECVFKATAQATADIMNDTTAANIGIPFGVGGLILIAVVLLGGGGFMAIKKSGSEKKSIMELLIAALVVLIIMVAGNWILLANLIKMPANIKVYITLGFNIICVGVLIALGVKIYKNVKRD